MTDNLITIFTNLTYLKNILISEVRSLTAQRLAKKLVNEKINELIDKNDKKLKTNE